MERPALLPRPFRRNARRATLLLGALLLVACGGGAGRPPGAGSSVPGASAGAAPPLTPEQRLVVGRQRLDASDYPAAEAHFRAAAVAPRRGPALIGLGDVLLITGRYDAAI